MEKVIDSEKVIATIREAARIMQEGRFSIMYKGGVENVVTSSDLAVQHYLTRELSALLPGCGFFCEEEDVKDTREEYVWIIDPIDGTANYARGLADCCISVALEHKGELVLGIVYSPARGELYHAEKGRGAFCNGKPIHVSDRPFEAGILCTAMSTYRKQYAKACSDIIYDIYMRSNDLRRYGSAAVELCLMASGYIELYFEMRLQPWDYAAGQLILEEAGGCAAGFDGNAPSLEHASMFVAANSRDNLDGILSSVRKYLPALPEDFI